MRKKTLRALKKRQFTRLCILYDLYTILMRSAQYIWFVHQVKKNKSTHYSSRKRRTRFIQLIASVVQSVQY